MKKINIIIAGGGTGGHIFPGIAIAQSLQKLNKDVNILFIGTKRGVESDLVPNNGFNIEFIDIGGLKNLSLSRKLKTLIKLPLAIIKSMILLGKFNAHHIIGVGGYVSAPVLLAAFLMGKKISIQEQNSIPGLTNKLLGKLSSNIFTAFNRAGSFFPAKKVHLFGNPIRQSIYSQKDKILKSSTANCLTVIGGSKGARAINSIVPKALLELKRQGIEIPVNHICGYDDFAKITSFYQKHNITAQVFKFSNDMIAIYKNTRLAIARSGAMTCSEISLLNIPTIFIPFPHAADDHQTYNARELSDSNGAILLKQADLTVKQLTQILADLWENKEKLANMKLALKQQNTNNAADSIARHVLSG